MPLPFTKGFGSGNDKLAASRSADAVAERADWDLQALLNKVLLDIDTAYFDVVRRMEALETTVGNRDMIRQAEGADEPAVRPASGHPLAEGADRCRDGARPKSGSSRR